VPALTTIRLSRSALAQAAFDALSEQVEEPGNPEKKREFLVSTSLVIRSSTASPGAGTKSAKRGAARGSR